MITTIGTVLAGLIGVGITFIGARFFCAPRAAADFGILGTPTEDATFRAWLSVKGIRDIASGIFIFLLMANGSAHLLGGFMLAATLIPVGDAIVVRHSKGPNAAVYGIHGATAAVMLVISGLLLLG